MKKLFFLALLIFFYSIQLYAQTTGKITGVVKDKNSGESLPGANILVLGTSLGAAADLYGEYYIQGIEPGTYTLRVIYIGYKNTDVTIQVASGETVIQNIEVEYEAVEGETILVTAQAEGQMEAINQQLSAREIKNVVASDRIQELPDANAAESVGRVPGVSVLRSGGEGNKVVIRGLSRQHPYPAL